MRATVYSAKPYETARLQRFNQGRHELVLQEEGLQPHTASLAAGSEAVILFTSDNASAPVLEQLASLGVKYLALRSAGYDHIDLEAAQKLGLRVAYVPDYSPHAIAEHAVALMLALNRRLLPADRRVREQDFRLDPLIGFDMHGKTVGLIGLGTIGKTTARILRGFGCTLLGYDVKPDEAFAAEQPLTYVPLEELLQQSDIVTLHCPLNEHTRYLIDKPQLAQMKPGAMLINTARGAILNTVAAIEALKSGHLGYLGLDVYEHEKGLFFYDHSQEILQDDLFARLLTLPNVLITGHQAFLTETALQNIAEAVLGHLDSWAKGEATRNELT